MDLNALIQPGTGYQLTNAININDRGEILAKAAPVGFTPDDDADLGHLALLVPCDDDHSGMEGCDYSTVDSDAVRARVHDTPPRFVRGSGDEDTPASSIAGRFRLGSFSH